jgi:hypothetical protein
MRFKSKRAEMNNWKQCYDLYRKGGYKGRKKKHPIENFHIFLLKGTHEISSLKIFLKGKSIRKTQISKKHNKKIF